jgi:hypothetical protein
MEDMKIADFNLEKSKEIANKFSDEYGNPYVVLKNNGYQVWSKFMADKCGRDYIWSTEDEDNV